MLQIIKTNNQNQIRELLIQIGVDDRGIDILLQKASYLLVKLKSQSLRDALLIKQGMLSSGGDAAIHKDAILLKREKTDILLVGNLKVFKNFILYLKRQPFSSLKQLADELSISLNNKEPLVWDCGRKKLKMHRVYIMGILNITPDSFYDGGEYLDFESAKKRTEELIQEGADIIDVGGESTRPGSESIDAKEEIKRILPVIRYIKKNFDILLSVDTTKSEVAEVALKEGADIINDISGLRFSPKMPEVISRYNAAVVINHIKGRPKDMQKTPQYEDLIWEIIEYLSSSIDLAKSFGIKLQKIVIDPGIGFGKKPNDNFKIIKGLSDFKILKRPILIGISRKSFIGYAMSQDNPPLPAERLEGTLAAEAIAVYEGADILRVHDVKETKRMLSVVEKLRGCSKTFL